MTSNPRPKMSLEEGPRGGHSVGGGVQGHADEKVLEAWYGTFSSTYVPSSPHGSVGRRLSSDIENRILKFRNEKENL